MERARIIVKGEVQGVGYRSEVKKIARKLDIVGKVRNVKPYDVEIIAEGEKKNLEGFTEQIRIKESPIEVEDIQTEFEPATGEFDYFEIERGDLGEELGERLDIAKGVMNRMVEKQDKTVETIKEGNERMIGKQDETIEKLDTFHKDTVQRFDNLDEKYGSISRDISTAIKGIEQVSRNTEKLIKSMDNTSKKTEQILERQTKQQENFTRSVDGLTGAILKLAEKNA